jgi:hypothetical protein
MHFIRELRLIRRRLFRRSESEKLLRAAYRETYRKELNYEDPRTFTEKLFHRMISMDRARDTTFTERADKYLVRDYVLKKVGEKHLVKLIWHGTDPRRIPFEALPDRCVIKTNHGSGGHLLVSGPVDRAAAIKHFNELLKENYYWHSREYQYYKIEPRILIEELIDDGVCLGPLDFRFWCFHGVTELIQVTNHANSIIAFYDAKWSKLNLSHRIGSFQDAQTARPANLSEMLAIAEALARDFDFVRVDLYNARGQIYFGELTFTPRAGIFNFEPKEWDEILGAKWRLSV